MIRFIAAGDRKVMMECLAGLGAEMDKVDANTPEPENGNGKVKLKRKPVV